MCIIYFLIKKKKFRHKILQSSYSGWRMKGCLCNPRRIPGWPALTWHSRSRAPQPSLTSQDRYSFCSSCSVLCLISSPHPVSPQASLLHFPLMQILNFGNIISIFRFRKFGFQYQVWLGSIPSFESLAFQYHITAVGIQSSAVWL